jgi:hypothetical protein
VALRPGVGRAVPAGTGMPSGPGVSEGPGPYHHAVDLVLALIAATVVIVSASMTVLRAGDVTDGPRVVGLAAAAAVGVAAAVVFLVPQVDLIPDGLDGVVDGAVVIVAGAAIAGLGWRRWHTG